MLVDEEGRYRLYHGVNVVYKIAPFYPSLGAFDPDNSLGPQDMDFLQDSGFNVVRLYVAWQGVEPTPGVYNYTYLKVLRSIVDSLAERNVSTILDCHQDLWSPHFCGEGAPEYAVSQTKPFPAPVIKPFVLDNTTGLPDRKDCNAHPFFYYYLSDSVSTSFQNFYDNNNGIRTRFAAFWRTVASAFANATSVLGYELLNEPWVGNFYKHPAQLTPKVADSKNLEPLYEEIHAAIRPVDDEHILFFEPTVAITSLPLEKFSHTGLKQGPGGPKYNDRQVLAYHDYCFLLTPDGQPLVNNSCRDTDGKLFHTRMDDLARLGVAGFVTEWGALANGTGKDAAEAWHVTGNADLYLQSWIYWSLKSYHDITTQASTRDGHVLEGLWRPDGSLDTAKLSLLTRTYAQAVAGAITGLSFSPDTAAFQLGYIANTSITAPTIIYLHESLHYPTGFTVHAPPSVTWSRVRTNYIHVYYTAQALTGETVTISIERK